MPGRDRPRPATLAACQGLLGDPLSRSELYAVAGKAEALFSGAAHLDNVVPACASCNTSKCNDEVTAWLRRKRLDERSFLLRHVELRLALGPAVETD